MSEQVVSGSSSGGDGANKKTAANSNTKQDNRALQDAQQDSSPPVEANNNDPVDGHVGIGKRGSETGERRGKSEISNNNNNQNSHHRHRRHSNSERSANDNSTSRISKSGRPSSSSSSTSTSSASFESSAGQQPVASSGAPEPVAVGQLNGGAATSVSADTPAGATGDKAHTLIDCGTASVVSIGQCLSSSLAPSSVSSSSASSSGNVKEKEQAVLLAAGEQVNASARGGDQLVVSAGGEALQNGSSNIALLPIATDSVEQLQNTTKTTSTELTNSTAYYQKEHENIHNCQARDLKTSAQGEFNQTTGSDNDRVEQQDDTCKQWSITSSGDQFCKRRKLSYFQTLLLRKWPYLAISICIMSSLLFGILLSALTVYLLHGATDCSGLARTAAAGEFGGASSPLLLASNSHEYLKRPGGDFHEPPASLDHLASLTASGDQLQQRSSSAGSGSDLSTSATSASTPFQRLPSSLWPIHYDLFVQPYIAEPFNFTGKVSIRIKCTEATDNITLHTNELELNERTISLQLAPQSEPTGTTAASRLALLANHQRRKSANLPKVKGLSADKQLQYSIIRLDSQLEAGQEYVLGIDFVGTLSDDLAGFYRIKYQRQNSSEITWIAATQFQATDARRAFPCFDEPLYKATFGIQIKHWKNMTALSNMPIIDRQDSPDGLWVTDTFSKSAKMSTYLVAFAVTNFESRSEGRVSVWARPGWGHMAEYALRIGVKIMRFYEEFFGIDYPLPKMDMIALPDFNAGAMENWGLITYRETAMLYDENSSSVSNKQRIAIVVAHELAHQWFGNLVTPKWWDDLWLNEGFASYVEFLGVDHVEPNWKMMDLFVVDEMQDVLKIDCLSSSHPISVPVSNPDEISEIFDGISYTKGASIIRMMSHFLTEPVFKQGLRRYLNALKFDNAEQADLWRHLTKAQHEFVQPNSSTYGKQLTVDVDRVMNSWTLQTGYPLVTLTRHYGNSRSATFEQVRYLSANPNQLNNNKTDEQTSTSLLLASNEKWEIPITFTSKSEQNWDSTTRFWMHQDDLKPVQLNSSLIPGSDNDWMLANINSVGYYRVNYDTRNWKLLIDQLNADHKQIPTTNRAQILDDMFELARIGIIDYKFAMEATKYMKGERDYPPWQTLISSFSYIDTMLQRTPIYGDWKDYVADLIAPYYARYKNVDWTMQVNTTDSSNVDLIEMYNLLLSSGHACHLDDHCIQKARSLFKEWRRTGINRINPLLRHTVYCTAIENGNKEDWDFLWKVQEKEANPSETDRILRALSCSKEIWILSRYLEWTFSKTKSIRRQDGSYIFRFIAKNNYGRDIAFNFMRERWSTIKEYYGKSSHSLGNFIRSVSTSMNTQVELNQLNNFFDTVKNDTGIGKRAIQIALEELESNVLWRNRYYKTIENWITDTRSKTTTNSGHAMAA